MEKYTEIKTRHQKEFNEFPMVFAFSNKQFAEAMAKLGLTENDTDKIYKFGDTGGFYRRSDSEKLREMLERTHHEMREALQNEEFAYEAFCHELANHEYCITCDPDDAVDALCLTWDEIKGNPAMLRALKRAMKAQKKEF